MLKPEFKKIDGVEYACTRMPALMANATLVKLTTMVGRPSLVLAAGAVKAKEAGDTDRLFANLVEIGVNQVFAELTPEDANEVMLFMMKGIRFKGMPTDKDLCDTDIFNSHFSGKLLSAYKVWAWGLEVNYKDFFDAARSNNILSKLRAVGMQVWNSQTSTPLSQESAQPTEE